MAHNPKAVPLAADLKFVENLTPTKAGEGLWATASAVPKAFAVHVPDPVSRQIGFIGAQPDMRGQGGPRQRPRGPTWFVKMDRNGDGDVSPAEWLGRKEDFDAIDTGKDGLISLEEAEAYDAKMRRAAED